MLLSVSDSSPYSNCDYSSFVCVTPSCQARRSNFLFIILYPYKRKLHWEPNGQKLSKIETLVNAAIHQVDFIMNSKAICNDAANSQYRNVLAEADLEMSPKHLPYWIIIVFLDDVVEVR